MKKHYSQPNMEVVTVIVRKALLQAVSPTPDLNGKNDPLDPFAP